MSDPALRMRLDPDHVHVELPDGRIARLPVGYAPLAAGDLARCDPPAPADLTNALGTVADHVDDLVLAHPDIVELLTGEPVVVSGAVPVVIACVELGRDDVPVGFELTRDAAEDVFRTVATECHADRAHNPGLPADHVEWVVAECCVLLGIMRRLGLDRVRVATEPIGPA